MGFVAAVPAAWAVVGTAISAAGTGYAIHSARQQARYASSVAAQNAAIARQVGAVEAGQERSRAARAGGAARAALGASGVDVGSGSALEGIADIAYIGEVSARRAEWSYANQALNFLSEGAMARSAGRNRSYESLLTGASTVFDLGSTQAWYLGKQKGKG